MASYYVTIREQGSEAVRQTIVIADNDAEARQAAVRKVFGRRAYFQRDTSRPEACGRIARTLTERERRARGVGTTWAADVLVARAIVDVEARS